MKHPSIFKLASALCLPLVLAACATNATPVTPTVGSAEMGATETLLAQTGGTPISTEGLTTETAGTAMPAATEDMSGVVSLQVMQDATVGPYLTDGKGRALYVFMNDTTSASTCYNACAQEWQPVLVTGTPSLATGLNALLVGTSLRTDGTTQLTYNGHPVYYNANDRTSGQMSGQASGNAWFLISPSGTAAQ